MPTFACNVFILELTRTIITTADGSPTIAIKEWDEQYHSVHGAVQESKHVYIHAGLDALPVEKTTIRILEFGFGTGLNALLALQWADKYQKNVTYHGIEAFPVSFSLIKALRYPEILQISRLFFEQMHAAEMNLSHSITPYFSFKKMHETFEQFTPSDNTYDIIFYDAFGPRVQPRLWQPEILEKAYHALCNNGIFVTYCAKGQVKRDLKTLGFSVETLAGPPGKREMIRAVKI